MRQLQVFDCRGAYQGGTILLPKHGGRGNAIVRAYVAETARNRSDGWARNRSVGTAAVGTWGEHVFHHVHGQFERLVR